MKQKIEIKSLISFSKVDSFSSYTFLGVSNSQCLVQGQPFVFSL